MATAAQEVVTDVVDPYRQEYSLLEIDVPVFVAEILARVKDPSGTYQPPQYVGFQFNSLNFTVGFRQKCQKCGRIGNRVDFHPEDWNKHQEYACPTCECRDVISSGQSERVELQSFIANHGVKSSLVYPNILSREGKILPQKDQSKQQIPQLKIVSTSKQGVQQAVAPNKYLSPIDGRVFDTLEQLAEHLESVETTNALSTTTAGRGPKAAPDQDHTAPTGVDTMGDKKGLLIENLARRAAEMKVEEAAEAPQDEQT